MDIEAWLRSLGLEPYASAFRDNDIDADLAREQALLEKQGPTVGARPLAQLALPFADAPPAPRPSRRRSSG